MQDEVANKWSSIELHAPWLVLAISLTITYLFWQNAHRAAIQEQRVAFDSQVSDVSDLIKQRMIYYEQVLYGVRAFYLNQHAVEKAEFAGYVASLEFKKNFPGLQGISYAPLIPAAQKTAHVRAMRRAGLSGYTIKPEGERPFYAPVAYIEPMDARNARVLGFDNLSNLPRKTLVEKARDEDSALISEKLVLKQEDEQAAQAGFLMFLPVFQHGRAHDTLVSRRRNVEGWFAASFRTQDLMAAVLDDRFKGIDIGLFDGEEISAQSRMFGALQQASPAFAATKHVEVAGRKWSVRVTSLPEFEAKLDRVGELNAAIAGGLSSLLLALITWLLMRDRRREIHTSSVIGRELEMRKRAEDKTQDLHLFNQAILEKSPAGISVYMANGQCVMANAAYAKAIGGTVNEILKQNFRSSESWRRNGLIEFADQALAKDMTIRRDVEGLTSFGKKVVLECVFSPVSISDSTHLLVIVNDVSERVEAEHALNASMHQLEEKELAKTRFLAAAGHDLRQPMAAANLFIDALKNTETNIRQNEIIERLDQSMATFNGLLDALLNVSKLDAGMIKPEFIPINVTELFNWLEQNFAPMTDDRSLGFRLYFPMREPLVVRSDIGLLKSVLMNLVSNAIKFTSHGAILVSARRRGNEVLFQVWDTGIGISDENVAHIFDEFYQINNPQRDRSGGLGLGLSIVKRALTLLGGGITCRSKMARGSVFEFRLPLDETVQEKTPQVAVTAPPREGVNALFARGKRFVVVEDDVLVAQAMTGWLEGMGGVVQCFHSAEDALQHSNIEYADYYIVDYMLGGTLNGIQLLNLIHQKLGRPINAVLVTGDTSSVFIRHAVDCDWPVLHKPINTSRLISVLSAPTRVITKS